MPSRTTSRNIPLVVAFLAACVGVQEGASSEPSHGDPACIAHKFSMTPGWIKSKSDMGFANRYTEYEDQLGYQMMATMIIQDHRIKDFPWNSEAAVDFDIRQKDRWLNNVGIKELRDRPGFTLFLFLPVQGFGTHPAGIQGGQEAVARGDADANFHRVLNFVDDLDINNAVFYLGIEVDLGRGGDCGDPKNLAMRDSFVAAFRRVADIVHAHGHRTAFWVDNSRDAVWGLENAFSGRDYVDTVSRSAYQTVKCDFKDGTKPILDHLLQIGRKYSVPISALECGLQNGAYRPGDPSSNTCCGDSPQWIEEFINWWAMVPEPDEIGYVNYFNCIGHDLDLWPHSKAKYIERLREMNDCCSISASTAMRCVRTSPRRRGVTFRQTWMFTASVNSLSLRWFDTFSRR